MSQTAYAAPLPFASLLGAYGSAARVSIVAAEVANARLLELRNPSASLLVVITQLRIQWIQTVGLTTQTLGEIEVFRLTNFTAVDTTNANALAAIPKRSIYPAATAQTLNAGGAGVANGMTGGTLTKSSVAINRLSMLLQTAVPTSQFDPGQELRCLTNYPWNPPLVLAQNEGVLVENRNVMPAAGGSVVTIEIDWAEVRSYP